MKNNQPVNNHRKNFKAGSQLITTTDLKGVIEYVNNDFVELSGYSREELVGQNHHVIRHPDMPEAAFESLWSTVKTDKEWRGIVKNRCKDGGYYWVDAYVVPLFKDGKKIGYQSIRSAPSKKQVQEAEKLYAQMRSDKSIKIKNKLKWGDISLAKKVNSLILIAFIALFSLVVASSNQSSDLVIYLLTAMLSICLFLLGWFVNREMIKPLKDLQKQLRFLASGDFTQQVDSHCRNEIGSTTMALKLLQARLRTIFGQFVETTQRLVSSAEKVSSGSSTLQREMKQQQQETNLVASAMTEMVASVGEVSDSATTASESASTADDTANEGAEVVNTAHSMMTKLTSEVTETASVINKLADDSNQITTITETISSIADQTNLLALNAAIEAARAGEQGRGFAVVADEVRSLASRTQEATNEIQTMISNLHTGMNSAVSAMEANIQRVSNALDEVGTSKTSFINISAAINEINQMNSHIASATEEQKIVSEEMNQNILSISGQSKVAIEEAGYLQAGSLKLNEMAFALQDQLNTLDIGISASEFDFEGAKQAHLDWKTRVRSYLDGDRKILTKAQASSHHDCKLGLWYYGEGRKRYQEHSDFRDIESPHAQLHHVIKEIVNKVERGEIEEAEKLYKEIEPLSNKIVGLIDKTKQSINQA